MVVQKKLTPFRKPRNSGGSPSGVSAPPIFDTRKMKKTKTWILCFRSSLARITGRISSIEAPVVPIQPASTVPMASKVVFIDGEPCMLPLMWIPPVTVNSASSNTMNGM